MIPLLQPYLRAISPFKHSIMSMRQPAEGLRTHSQTGL